MTPLGLGNTRVSVLLDRDTGPAPNRDEVRAALAYDRRCMERDAEAYRFLRDAPGDVADEEAANLWADLLTKKCRGDEWDRTVAKLRELYADRGWV